jgi:hypothetical protein
MTMRVQALPGPALKRAVGIGLQPGGISAESVGKTDEQRGRFHLALPLKAIISHAL